MRPILSQDARDLLAELQEAEARFLVVGAHALAVHGVSRATLDFDVFVEPSSENAPRVLAALRAFGAPIAAHGVTLGDFERAGTVYQLGLPPNRIDLITAIDGVSFDSAWRGRVEAEVDGLQVPFLGRQELIRNKSSTGRAKDKADVEALEAAALPHE